MFFYLVSEFTPSGEGLNHFFFPTLGTSALIARLKLRVVIHHFWWFLFCIKQRQLFIQTVLRVLLAYYFRAHLSGKTPLSLFICQCNGSIWLVACSNGFKLFLLLLEDDRILCRSEGKICVLFPEGIDRHFAKRCTSKTGLVTLPIFLAFPTFVS